MQTQWLSLVALVLFALVALGCATPNVAPPRATPHCRKHDNSDPSPDESSGNRDTASASPFHPDSRIAWFEK